MTTPVPPRPATSSTGRSAADPLRVAALDDHPLFLRGLVDFLAGRSDASVTVTGTGVTELLDHDLATLDVVLLDSDLRDGSDLLENVAAIVATGLPVVVMASQGRPARLATALRAGASDVVLKSDSEEAIVAALHRAVSGSTAPHRERLDDPITRVHVSAREREVLTELAHGRSWSDVAQRLGISVTTARTHVVRVVAAMAAEGVEVRGGPREAVAIAQASGLIDPFSGPRPDTADEVRDGVRHETPASTSPPQPTSETGLPG